MGIILWIVEVVRIYPATKSHVVFRFQNTVLDLETVYLFKMVKNKVVEMPAQPAPMMATLYLRFRIALGGTRS